MNKKRKLAEDDKIETRKRQDKQAIHQVQYFLRFAYFVARIENTKNEQIGQSP